MSHSRIPKTALQGTKKCQWDTFQGTKTALQAWLQVGHEFNHLPGQIELLNLQHKKVLKSQREPPATGWDLNGTLFGPKRPPELSSTW